LLLLLVHLYHPIVILVLFLSVLPIFQVGTHLLLLHACDELLLLHLYLFLKVFLHFLLLVLFLVLVFLLVGRTLIDLRDVRALGGWLLLLLLLVVVVILVIIIHVFFVLVLLDWLRTHHVMIHSPWYLRTIATVVLFFLLIFTVFILTHLLLLLLLVFLKHHELLLLLLLSVEESLRRQVAGEVGGGGIKAVVVLGGEQQLLLLVRQVSIRVQVRIPKNSHVFLELADLSEIAHEGLGDLLHQEGLVCHVEKYLLLLLRVGTLQVRVLLSRLLQRLLLTLC